MVATDSVLGFKAEYFDPLPQLVKTYVVKYFTKTHEVEMQDIKAHRTFLKRSKLPDSILPSDFQIDNQVLVYGRVLKLVGYADPATESQLGPKTTRQLVFLAPSIYSDFGAVLEQLEANDFSLLKIKTLGLVGNEAATAGELLGCDGRKFEEGMGLSLAMVVRGNNSGRVGDILSSWGDAVSCTGSEKALDYFFSQSWPTTATLDSCTLCLVKAHAVKAKNTGSIIKSIQSQGYEVSAVESFTLDRAVAGEFFELYRDVVDGFRAHLDELVSGPIVALEIRAEDAVQTFRKSAGPYDVEMAKELFPSSLRAKFGDSNVRNAVHCTDLPTDGKSECSYFFDILHAEA